MKEVTFLQKNSSKWKKFEDIINGELEAEPDELASLYIQASDDLSYAKTFFPNSKTFKYLNKLTGRLHLKIYKNQKESSGRFKKFWLYELPEVLYNSRREIYASFIIFVLSMAIGAVSSENDDSFVRLIMGDGYVNMTLSNIEKGDPMAVYKQVNEVDMFLGITVNNVMVSFYAFVFGLAFTLGTAYILIRNGIMIGSFQYFFHQQGLFFESFKTVWIHGTIEIASIIIAGAAGFVLGNGFLFPGTYSRGLSFSKGAKKALKIVIGLIPMFTIAGLLEGFVTRHTGMPIALSILIIGGSAAFVIYYFIIYPSKIHKRFIIQE